MTTPDPLAEIDGIKPLQTLADGQEIIVKSESNPKGKPYKVKRLGLDISCTCPAWRNQKKFVNSRTCKHLKATLGEEYEDARMKLRQEEAEQGMLNVHTTVDAKSPKKRGTKRKQVEDEIDDDEVGDGDSPMDAIDPSDPMHSIHGVAPKTYMADGSEKEISSQSSNSKYKIKRTGDHYYCTCPSWRMQKDSPVNARSCKHLRSVFGDAYEDARLSKMNPDADDNPGDSPRKRAKPNSTKKPTSSYTPPPGLLLANKWNLDDGPDPTGWWCSEKLDGVRAFFDGENFKSRNGHNFAVPQELIEGMRLPKGVTLDGELFGGRGKFNDTVSIVRSSTSAKWPSVSYLLFDMPSFGELPFEGRMKKMEQFFGSKGSRKNDFVKVVKQTKVKNREHVFEMLKEVEEAGGEGLMLRKPKSQYEGRRSGTLLKIKTFSDAEAKIVGYTPGRGKHHGVTGALKCEMASGKTFSVGSGLSDALRARPPKIGTIITYRYQELTPDGVPRFPTYVGEAIDKDGPTDPSAAPKRLKKPASSGSDS